MEAAGFQPHSTRPTTPVNCAKGEVYGNGVSAHDPAASHFPLIETAPVALQLTEPSRLALPSKNSPAIVVSGISRNITAVLPKTAWKKSGPDVVSHQPPKVPE